MYVCIDELSPTRQTVAAPMAALYYPEGMRPKDTKDTLGIDRGVVGLVAQ